MRLTRTLSRNLNGRTAPAAELTTLQKTDESQCESREECKGKSSVRGFSS